MTNKQFRRLLKQRLAESARQQQIRNQTAAEQRQREKVEKNAAAERERQYSRPWWMD